MSFGSFGVDSVDYSQLKAAVSLEDLFFSLSIGNYQLNFKLSYSVCVNYIAEWNKPWMF